MKAVQLAGDVSPPTTATLCNQNSPGIVQWRKGMPQCRHYMLAVIAASALIAIVAVLISPAVPSAPTLLPVSTLVLVGIIVLAAGVIVGERGALLVFNHPELRLSPPQPALLAAGLPLRC